MLVDWNIYMYDMSTFTQLCVDLNEKVQFGHLFQFNILIIYVNLHVHAYGHVFIQICKFFAHNHAYIHLYTVYVCLYICMYVYIYIHTDILHLYFHKQKLTAKLIEAETVAFLSCLASYGNLTYIQIKMCTQTAFFEKRGQ